MILKAAYTDFLRGQFSEKAAKSQIAKILNIYFKHVSHNVKVDKVTVTVAAFSEKESCDSSFQNQKYQC